MVKEAKSLIVKGQFEQASIMLLKLLDEYAQHSDAQYCLAICQRKLNEPNDALATLGRLHQLEPKHSQAYQERGYNYQALGQRASAIAEFERAVQLNPALHGSWRALTNLLSYPKIDEAQRQLAWLTSLPPELVSVASYTHQGLLQKAEALCRQFLKREPHHPEAMRLLAQLGSKFQILDDAEFLLESCVEFHPQFLHARLDYVEVLHRRQKFDKALEQAQALLDIDPTNVGFVISLANAQQASGNYAAAVAGYQSALTENVDNHSVHLALGHALKTSGEVEPAIDAYRSAYQAKPDFGDAFWSLANLKTYQFKDHEIDHMQECEQASVTSELDRIHLCFALGKAFEDRQHFDQSFDYYARGNVLKKADCRYDAQWIKNELDYQKAHLDRTFFEQRSPEKDYCDAPDPIFIVGLPRAGSTLLEQILASHSQVDGTMELVNIIGMAHAFNGRQAIKDKPRYPSILSDIGSEECQSLGERYIQETKLHRQGAPFFIDKMPNNFRHIGLIHLILPNAKIIDARREPMACCFSGFKQLFAEGQEFSYGLADIGAYYNDYVQIMDHWDQALPGKVLRVQHEDVIDDLESQVMRMLDFCGLEFEQNCIDFHKSKRPVKTPSSEQVRQPIYKSGMDLWKNYEADLDPLKKALNLFK